MVYARSKNLGLSASKTLMGKVPKSTFSELALLLATESFEAVRQQIEQFRSEKHSWATDPALDALDREAALGLVELAANDPDSPAFASAAETAMSIGALDEIGKLIIGLMGRWRTGTLTADHIPTSVPDAVRELLLLVVEALTANPAPNATEWRKRAKKIVDRAGTELPQPARMLFLDLGRAFVAMRTAHKNIAQIPPAFRKFCDGHPAVAIAAFFIGNKSGLLTDGQKLDFRPPTPRGPMLEYMAWQLRGQLGYAVHVLESRFLEQYPKPFQNANVNAQYPAAPADIADIADKIRSALHGGSEKQLDAILLQLFTNQNRGRLPLNAEQIAELLPPVIEQFNAAASAGIFVMAESWALIGREMVEEIVAKNLSAVMPISSADALLRDIQIFLRQLQSLQAPMNEMDSFEMLDKLLDELFGRLENASTPKVEDLTKQEISFVATSILSLGATPITKMEMLANEKMQKIFGRAGKTYLEFHSKPDVKLLIQAALNGRFRPDDVRQLARRVTDPVASVELELGAEFAKNFRRMTRRIRKALEKHPESARVCANMLARAFQRDAKATETGLDMLLGPTELQPRHIDPLLKDFAKPTALAQLDIDAIQDIAEALRIAGHWDSLKSWRKSVSQRLAELLQTPAPPGASLVALARRLASAMATSQDGREERIRTALRDLRSAVRPHGADPRADAIQIWKALTQFAQIALSFPDDASTIAAWQDAMIGGLDQLPEQTTGEALFASVYGDLNPIDLGDLATIFERRQADAEKRPVWALILADRAIGWGDIKTAQKWLKHAEKALHSGSYPPQWHQLKAELQSECRKPKSRHQDFSPQDML